MGNSECSGMGFRNSALREMQTRLQDRAVTASDIAALRKELPTQGITGLDDAEIAFEIEMRAADRCRAWSDLFVELMTDYLVWGERPTGTLSDASARWLLEKADEAHTSASVFLVVNILDEAAHVPAWFAAAVRERALRLFVGTNDRSAAQAA